MGGSKRASEELRRMEEVRQNWWEKTRGQGEGAGRERERVSGEPLWSAEV